MKNTSTSEYPLVSVVTATYNLVVANRSKTIAQCIESVRNQTYLNIEHIIIDGASSDGTLDLLQKCGGGGFAVYSEPDDGIYDAFNKGLARAKGKYIAFLNSDDMWHDPRGIEYSVRMMERHHADFSYSPWLFDPNNGHRKSKHKPLISSFFYKTPFCHQTMLTRTEELRNMGGFNINFQVFADLEVIIRLMLNGAIPVYVPLCFTTFRDGGFYGLGNNSGDKSKREYQELFHGLYSPYASEDEIRQIYKLQKLPPSFYNLLKQKIHPSIFNELRRNCKWDKKEKNWRYESQIFSWRAIARRIKTRICNVFR